MFEASPEQLCQKSSSSSTGGCPHASSNKSFEAAATKSYTVNFEPLSSKSFYRKIIALIKEICSRVSPSSIKSAWYIGTQNDLSQPFCVPGSREVMCLNLQPQRVQFM